MNINQDQNQSKTKTQKQSIKLTESSMQGHCQIEKTGLEAVLEHSDSPKYYVNITRDIYNQSIALNCTSHKYTHRN